MSDSARFSAEIDDEDDNITENEITAVPFNSNLAAKYETTHKLESFANIREVGQLKKHLARIEEIYIGLAKSWKDSEENHDHVIIYLEEQLKTAKASLAEAELTAAEDVAAVKEQMRALQEKMSKQHETVSSELSNVKKAKENIEQSLQEAKEQIVDLNANVALQKQRAEQTANEVSKRNKELSAASQEINFLKIQLEAEKDILKTTAKNHDQVISYLKEQLRAAKENIVEAQGGELEEINSITEKITEVQQEEKLELSDTKAEEIEELLQTAHDPIAELKAQVALNKQKAEQEVADNTKNQLDTNQETAKSVTQNPVNNLKQSPILTAQQTREQLKMRLQGLQEVNELEKRNKESHTPVQESTSVKVQPESNNESSKSSIKSQDQGQVADLKASVALKQKDEQEISERDKLNKNLSSGSQKIDVFW